MAVLAMGAAAPALRLLDALFLQRVALASPPLDFFTHLQVALMAT